MAFGNTYQQWQNLSAQRVDGSSGDAPEQGPEPPPAQQGQQGQGHIGQQWPVKARRVARPARPMTAAPSNLMAMHFGAQDNAIAAGNNAIAGEMASRKKVAAQQRDLAFKAQEGEKNRQHEMQMAQMSQKRTQNQGQEGGLGHGQLDLLEPLLTGSRTRRANKNNPMSAGERTGRILQRLL